MEWVYGRCGNWEEGEVDVKRVLSNALKNKNLSKNDKNRLKINFEAMQDDNENYSNGIY